MSVSDPLLRTLKKIIINLCIVNKDNNASLTKDIINDDNPALEPFCEILEEILRKGLYKVGGMFNVESKDYWNWMSDLPKLIKQHNNQNSYKLLELHTKYEDCLRIVKSSSERISTGQGKGRLMIRCLLQNKILHWPIEMLCFSLNDVTRYYSDFNSLLSNEILAHMLISQISQVSVLNFNLNLQNCMFLDQSWILPTLKKYEFVPCKELGVSLISVDAYHIVESLQRGGVAEEENLLETGDVIDELFGHCIKWCKYPLKDIMQANHNLPVRMSVIKLRLKNGCTYPPIYKLLRKVNMLTLIQPRYQSGSDLLSSLPMHTNLSNDFNHNTSKSNTDILPYHALRYVGSTYIGSYGGVSKIEGAIAETLKHYNDPSTYIPVYIELGEKDVTIRRAILPNSKKSVEDDLNSDDDDDMVSKQPSPILFTHAYPQISSCGRRVDCTRFLAYVVGESTCTVSRHFVCHVFEARSEVDSKTILCNIAQGFERTHWTI